MKKRNLLMGALAFAASVSMASYSTGAVAAYPDHEVKIIVPFAPGGATDLIFRLISERAERALGQPIVPMNMAGAGGSKGSLYVKGQKPDGYTILGGHEFLLTTKYGGMVNFGLEAFEPVCTLTMTPLTIHAGSHVPYNSYKEMIEYAKKNPGKIVITMSPASLGYVVWKEVATRAGLDLNKHFKTVVINGVGPQNKALLGAHADLLAGDIPSNLDYVKDGRMKAFAVCYSKRLPQLPDMPTTKELGYDFSVGATRAIFVPKGTPKKVIDTLAKAYEAACKDPEVIKKIQGMGNEMLYLGPKATGEYFGKQDATFKANLTN